MKGIYKNYIKRILDFSISLCALICLSPFLLIVTICLYFANKGAGVFFYQERPGKDSRIFKIVKFKSMTDEKDLNGQLLPDKERLTKVGWFLRKTSIDELPQLFNVLKGEMALIGPRPLLPDYLPYYTQREQLRHTVRPGITGWAQIHGRNNTTWDDKLENDAYYVEHMSFIMDCRIVLTTIKNVMLSKDVNVVAAKSFRLDDERKLKKYDNDN